LNATALIPAHNEADTIGLCVAAIRASTYPLAQIIVVADACTDDTAQRARHAGATVVESDVKDKAGAQNTVLPSIDTELIVGFDADTFPEPDCVERMVEAMRRDQLDAVCGTVLPVQPRGLFIRARRYAYALGRRWWRIAQSRVGRVQVLTGACYVFRTTAIKAVGGFPSVGISADMDATWTLHNAGYRLAYVGDAVAHTVDPETFAAYRLQMRRWAAGYYQTMAKHRRQLWRPQALLVVATALVDLLTLPVTYAWIVWMAFTNPPMVRWYWAWVLGHLLITTVLVATVVGWKEAVLGAVPYTLVNFYNKGLYLWTFVREWILGCHYASWTGRHGRATVITSIRATRVAGLAWVTLAGILAVDWWGGRGLVGLALVAAAVAVFAPGPTPGRPQHRRRRFSRGYQPRHAASRT
jgi:poly-beta-1,6-N-acetyl-D-glucosamine synthase